MLQTFIHQIKDLPKLKRTLEQINNQNFPGLEGLKTL